MYELEVVTPFIETCPSKKIEKDSIHILGVCFDGTTSFRPGARFGPNAIREASYGLETYSPYLNSSFDDKNIYDLGNLPFFPSKINKCQEFFKEMTKEVKLKEDKISFLCLGGEHSISSIPIELYLKEYPDLCILHLDAHADLRDGYLEEHFSHASVIRRSLDLFGPEHSLVQYGIGSGTAEEFQYMKSNHTLKTSLKELCDFLEELPSQRPIYLTLDLDYFDPAFMPGTGTPEAGGEDFHSFIKIIKILKSKNFVGADVVELAPTIDSTGNSSCFASKVVREILLTL